MADEEKERFTRLVEQVLQNEGCELADVALSRYKSSTTARLFVYAVNSLTLDQCAHLSRIIGDAVEGTELFERGYTLEVSSPGLDRPLTTARDFRYRIGETIRIEFVDPQRKKVTGVLVGMNGEKVQIRTSEADTEIALSEIDKARIVF